MGSIRNYGNNIMTCSDFQIGVLQNTPPIRAEFNTGAYITRIYLLRAAAANCGDDDDKTL